jgi:hypothetical protein
MLTSSVIARLVWGPIDRCRYSESPNATRSCSSAICSMLSSTESNWRLVAMRLSCHFHPWSYPCNTPLSCRGSWIWFIKLNQEISCRKLCRHKTLLFIHFRVSFYLLLMYICHVIFLDAILNAFIYISHIMNYTPCNCKNNLEWLHGKHGIMFMSTLNPADLRLITLEMLIFVFPSIIIFLGWTNDWH